MNFLEDILDFIIVCRFHKFKHVAYKFYPNDRIRKRKICCSLYLPPNFQFTPMKFAGMSREYYTYFRLPYALQELTSALLVMDTNGIYSK